MKLFILSLCALGFSQPAEHLLLTRIITQPTIGESIFIYNPTDATINLNNYYICDDKDYYKIQTESDMSPSNPINGFTAKFPNITINPEETLSIVLNYKYNEFYGQNFSPDLVMYLEQENSMIETEDKSFGQAFSDTNGDEEGCIGSQLNYCVDENDQNCVEECDDINPVGKLNDDTELVILFHWDGNINNPVKDIDYFVWGGTFDVINKTENIHYENDTPYGSQSPFMKETTLNYAYSRIDGAEESGENQSDGNGITNHDETSENFTESWTIIRIPEFNFGCTDINALNYDPTADHNIDTFYEHNTELFEFNLNLSCRYSFQKIINNEFEVGYPNIKVFGKVVNYFDIRTVSSSGSGPQNITIEDGNGYRLTLTVWDWEVANSTVSQITNYYNKNSFFVFANGDLGLYEEENEWQIDVSSNEKMIITKIYTPDGEFTPGSSVMETSINPEPFVLIPTLNETLNYNFTFPEKSRAIVRIFDLSGRFITSLIDKYYAESGIVDDVSWNGRDHLGQIVAPGTYIMHLEVMNPSTGKTQMDAAPVVIGVKN